MVAGRPSLLCMRKNLLLVMAFVLIVLMGTVVWLRVGSKSYVQDTPDYTANTAENEEVTVIENVEVDVDADGQEDALQDIAPVVSSGGNITVSLPHPMERVGAHSMVVVGEARVFENAFNWRLKNRHGEVLASGKAEANASDIGTFGPFALYITYSAIAGEVGSMEVYSNSARDGSETNLVRIPVQFAGEDIVEMYVANARKAGAGNECGEVFAVPRFVVASEVPAIRLRHILWTLFSDSITLDEKADDYSTSIPSGVRLNSLQVNEYGAEVTIDVSSEIETGGSCRVQSIRKQIEETVRGVMGDEFSVTITVDGGSADEALQP